MFKKLGLWFIGGFIAAFVLSLTVVPMLVLSSLSCGFVLMKLWSWFMVPIFSLPELSFWAAVGIVLVATFLTSSASKFMKEKDSKKDEERNNEDENLVEEGRRKLKKDTKMVFGSFLVSVFIAPSITLLLGWIIYSLM